jgi:hypothetical protein
MHKTQRRVMLKFLKQHGGEWYERNDTFSCDLCHCEWSKGTEQPITVASYISKSSASDIGPYSHIPPRLCIEHARELGVVW